MEEEHHFPCHSCRITLKPPLPLEAISSRRRRPHSTETNTISTSGASSSSHLPKLSRVVSTHPGLSIVIEMESSSVPVDTEVPISETIHPKLDVIQLEVDRDPIIILP